MARIQRCGLFCAQSQGVDARYNIQFQLIEGDTTERGVQSQIGASLRLGYHSKSCHNDSWSPWTRGVCAHAGPFECCLDYLAAASDDATWQLSQLRNYTC